MKTIYLDPGHGGEDPGAVGASGLRESEVALDVCLTMRDILHGAARVHLTRDRDDYVGLSSRAELANRDGADLFLSVHCNAAENPQARGYEVWTSPGQTGADPFATALYRAYEDEFPSLPGRKDMSDGDEDKESKFTVLTKTHMPAALFELEFISHPKGEAFLGDIVERERMAEALAMGVLNHLGISPQDSPPLCAEEASGKLERALRLIKGALEDLV